MPLEAGLIPGFIEIIVNEGPGNYEVEILPLGFRTSQKFIWNG